MREVSAFPRIVIDASCAILIKRVQTGNGMNSGCHSLCISCVVKPVLCQCKKFFHIHVAAENEQSLRMCFFVQRFI